MGRAIAPVPCRVCKTGKGLFSVSRKQGHSIVHCMICEKCKRLVDRGEMCVF
jgi:hypothetical protein